MNLPEDSANSCAGVRFQQVETPSFSPPEMGRSPSKPIQAKLSSFSTLILIILALKISKTFSSKAKIYFSQKEGLIQTEK